MNEFKSLQSKLGKFQSARLKLMTEEDPKYNFNNIAIIRAYKDYLLLSDEEQQRRMDVWNAYYLEVRKNLAAEMFYEQNRYFKESQKEYNPDAVKKVKEIRKDMRDLLDKGEMPITPMPSFPDPNEFLHGNIVRIYNHINKSISDTLQQLKDLESGDKGDLFI